ncbi:MAG: flagellar motor protein MotB [Alphaproteobacteria bacterium]|nr:flagellar motor protein MotB [Alphaproteobacteria bacterium]MCB9761289.1 flagellar motor protein MotB [Alphaproteobacteria bacterium]
MQRRSYTSDEGWLLSYADLITNLLIFFVMILAAAEISRTRMQQIAESLSGIEQPESLSSIQEKIEEQIEREGLQDMIRTDLDDDGLRLSLNSGVVFDSGSAVIQPDQAPVLDRMLAIFVPYAEHYNFAVEGHTDTKPITNGSFYKSNWELSTDRANAVRAQLETVGIDRQRVRVEGYADTVALPAESLAGLSEEEALARHRRVVVRIY